VLSPTGNTDDSENNNNPDGNGAPRPDQSSTPVPGGSDTAPGNWRETALFNGVENPRMPAAAVLAVPRVSVKSALNGNTTKDTSPAFRFGASAKLGTRLEGAFSLKTPTRIRPASRAGSATPARDAGVGFD
jgi:hypothetical protein